MVGRDVGVIRGGRYMLDEVEDGGWPAAAAAVAAGRAKEEGLGR